MGDLPALGAVSDRAKRCPLLFSYRLTLDTRVKKADSIGANATTGLRQGKILRLRPVLRSAFVDTPGFPDRAWCLVGRRR